MLLGKDPFETNLIIAHIGNGSSINAVKNGCSYDTSMGMTPLEGLVMGTRSGDIDPGIIFHMMKKAGFTPATSRRRSTRNPASWASPAAGPTGATSRTPPRPATRLP